MHCHFFLLEEKRFSISPGREKTRVGISKNNLPQVLFCGVNTVCIEIIPLEKNHVRCPQGEIKLNKAHCRVISESLSKTPLEDLCFNLPRGADWTRVY